MGVLRDHLDLHPGLLPMMFRRVRQLPTLLANRLSTLQKDSSRSTCQTLYPK